jgi:predicted SAM-dependent methyltransferase
MGRKLHIGGQVKAAGWEVLDANPGPIVDHVANARDLSFFPDQTFERIYASHVVEHFDYNGELLATLTEWHRVLVPAGFLYVSVPDLDILARLFLDRQSLSFEDRRGSFSGNEDDIRRPHGQIRLSRGWLE